jgi:hypothetical protein
MCCKLKNALNFVRFNIYMRGLVLIFLIFLVEM